MDNGLTTGRVRERDGAMIAASPVGSLDEAEALLRLLAGNGITAAIGIRQMAGLLADGSSAGQSPDAGIRRAEARYRVLVEQIPAITFMAALDEGLNEMYVSPQIEKMLGYSQKEWLEDPILWYTRLHPDDRERWHVEFSQTCATGQPFCAEYRFIARDGRVVWVHGEAQIVRDEQGRPLFLQGVAFDITVRKQAEESLRRSQHELEVLVQQRTAELTRAIAAVRDQEARLRSVVETAVDGIVVIDEQGRIESFNPAAEGIFGHPAAEVLGRNVTLLMPAPYREEHDGYMARYLNGGAPRIIGTGREIVGRRKDGSTFPMDLAVSEMQLARGRRFTGIVRDITERKRVEEELQQAKQAAEAASRMKSEFLANMSHEIRTPMNGVLGMTELALRTSPAPEVRRYLTAVRQSGEQLLRVINDILDFSKIEAGKIDFESIDFSLRESAAGLMRSLALRAHEKGLELVYHIPSDVPDGLVGDPVRVRQVIVNLIGNAIKFTPRGEVALTVQSEDASGNAAADELCLRFSVRDTGIGIPPDKLQAIFQPFTQADGSTTRKYGGTGLGLTISMRLVEAMGGRLWVESVPGQGATFHFTARFGRSKTVRASTPPAELSQLVDLPVMGVDDNATNRQILQELLAGWRLRPTLVESGPAALTALAQAAAGGRPFRLAVLDFQMPEMDGLALAERIRRESPDTPIIILTSMDQSGDIASARALGVAEYLVKPVDPSDLLEAIARALAPAKEAPAATAACAPAAPPVVEGSLRILLAEDNAINQVVASRMLESLGHAVVVVGDGRAALEALAAESFDLAFFDVQMPEMDGFEATAALRARERQTGGRLPVIALTAHAMKGDRERCLAAGMDGYVAKPIRTEEIAQELARLFPMPDSSTDLVDVSRSDDGTTGPSPLPAALDRGELLERVGGNLQVLARLVGLFQADCPRQTEALEAALAREDARTVERVAHSLKGTVGSLAAHEAHAAALCVETAAREGDLRRADDAFQNLRATLDNLQSALAAMLAESGRA